MRKRVDGQSNIMQIPTEADSPSNMGEIHQRTQGGPEGRQGAEEKSVFYPVKTSLK